MLHLGTDKVEHLVVPVCQRFVLQLPAKVKHQFVLVWVNRHPGNSVQPLASQFQIGAAIGVEQLFFFNIKLTIQQLENTNKSLEIVTAQNKKQDDRLTALEKAPGTFGNKLWWAVIAALVSGLVAYELTMLLH